MALNLDKFKLFQRRTWANINLHTVNGTGLKYGRCSPTYIRKGIRVEMTRDEFNTFCAENRDIILTLERPSIDRIDSNDHYRIGNIRIIPLSENCRMGSANQLKESNARLMALNKKCLWCGKRLERKTRRNGILERTGDFMERRHCGPSCGQFTRRKQERDSHGT